MESESTQTTPTQNPTPEIENSPTSKSKKKMLVGITTLLVVGAGLGWWFVVRDDGSGSGKTNNTNQSKQISSFDECVVAGNGIMQSFPEQCAADGKIFTKNEEIIEQTKEVIVCNDDENGFANKEFGAAFCYPTEWGSASVMDAKIDTADTGHREAVRFSTNTKFIVGGVSDDWTTEVGRDVGCQEPNNNVPPLSEYNTEWHDVISVGGSVDYARRSLESSAGGYDMSEEVSSILNSGVCVQGHKVINGSRYRVISAAYYRDFAETSGIINAQTHMDNPTVLFTEEERGQFDALLASATSY